MLLPHIGCTATFNKTFGVKAFAAALHVLHRKTTGSMLWANMLAPHCSMNLLCGFDIAVSVNSCLLTCLCPIVSAQQALACLCTMIKSASVIMLQQEVRLLNFHILFGL